MGACPLRPPRALQLRVGSIVMATALISWLALWFTGSRPCADYIVTAAGIIPLLFCTAVVTGEPETCASCWACPHTALRWVVQAARACGNLLPHQAAPTCCFPSRKRSAACAAVGIKTCVVLTSDILAAII